MRFGLASLDVLIFISKGGIEVTIKVQSLSRARTEELEIRKIDCLSFWTLACMSSWPLQRALNPKSPTAYTSYMLIQSESDSIFTM